MNVSKLETEVRAQMETLAKTATTAADTTALVNEITTDIRTVSYLLHPPMLDEAGLEFALRWYVEGFAERSEIDVTFDFPDNLGRLLMGEPRFVACTMISGASRRIWRRRFFAWYRNV